MAGDHDYDFGQAHLFYYDVDALDDDGDVLEYQLVSDYPGITIDSETGVIEGFPVEPGSYDFTITVQDGRGGSDEQHFALDVRDNTPNYAPEITSDPILNARSQHTYTYVVRAFDANFDSLIFSLSEKPDGMTIETVNSDTALITWRPEIDWDLEEDEFVNRSVTVLVKDPRGGTYERQFTIKVAKAPINNNPEFTSSPPQRWLAGTTYVYPITAKDDDGDSFYVSLLSKPDGMVKTLYTDTILWETTEDDIGFHSVIIAVRDVHGGVTYQDFMIEIIPPNRQPTIESDPSCETTVGKYWSYLIDGRDLDGDNLQYYLHPDCRALGMEINSNTGLVEWTPTVIGDFQLEVAVSDGNTEPVYQAFVLSVTATDPPKIQGSLPRYWTVGLADSAQFKVISTQVISDRENGVYLDEVSKGRGFALTAPVGADSDFLVDGHYEYQYTLTWTPQSAGIFDVEITAKDDLNVIGTGTVELEAVLPVNPTTPPEVIEWTFTPEGPGRCRSIVDMYDDRFRFRSR